jgi:hypothetical protein
MEMEKEKYFFTVSSSSLSVYFSTFNGLFLSLFYYTLCHCRPVVAKKGLLTYFNGNKMPLLPLFSTFHPCVLRMLGRESKVVVFTSSKGLGNVFATSIPTVI